MSEMKKQNGERRSSKITLNSHGIKDSDNIFAELSNLADITEVDLSSNNLTRLPEDLSGLANLQSLDITNNPFTNVRN